MSVEIASLDLAPYQSAPQLPAEATLTLSRDLVRAMPEGAPSHVVKAAARMTAVGDEVQQVLIDRIAGTGALLGTEAAFDGVVDRLWAAGRRRLEYWMIFEQEGFDLLDPGEQKIIDLDDKRQKAEVARELDQHLFGEDGLGFLRKPFAQQVAAMASRLSFIADSDAVAVYEEVLGADLLEALEVVQGRYEAMVHERAIRADTSVSLRQLRGTLQRAITFYATCVLTMLDEDEPKSVELVLDALRPMVNARGRRGRSSEDAGTDEFGELDGVEEIEAQPGAVADPGVKASALGEDAAESNG